MQEAIDEIVYFMDQFPEINNIRIIERNDIEISYYQNHNFLQKSVKSAIELKDWCEENLEMKSC